MNQLIKEKDVKWATGRVRMRFYEDKLLTIELQELKKVEGVKGRVPQITRWECFSQNLTSSIVDGKIEDPVEEVEDEAVSSALESGGTG